MANTENRAELTLVQHPEASLTRLPWTDVMAMPDPTFDFFANLPSYKEMNRSFVIKNVLADVQPGEVIVDLACGPGVNTQTITENLKERGIEATVVGMDIYEPDLEIARQRVPDATFIQTDATKLDLPDNSVDKLMIFNAIQEMPDPDAVIKEAYRVLKPGGKIFVVSGFTDESFVLDSSIKGYENEPEKHHKLKRQGKANEMRKHNTVRETAFALLGEQQDKSPKGEQAFAPQGNAAHINRFLHTGFVNPAIQGKELAISSYGMELIGYHRNWLEGTFRDMTNKENHSIKEQMLAYISAIRMAKRVHEKAHCYDPYYPELTYPRMFYMFEGQKPFTEETGEEVETAEITPIVLFEAKAA